MTDFTFTLFRANLYFSFNVANLFSTLSFFAFYLSSQLVLNQILINRLTSFWGIIKFSRIVALNYIYLLTIASRHSSSCTSNVALRAISTCNYFCKLETSRSSSKCHLCKTCFLLSKLVYKIALPLTSFSTLCCKSLFTISDLWITNSSNFELSTWSIELPRLPTELFEIFTYSIELLKLFICSIAVFGLSTYLTNLSNLLGLLAKFSTPLCSVLELHATINNSTSFVRLIIYYFTLDGKF